MAKGEATPKREVLSRLEKIAEGLREGGYADDAEALARVCRSLRSSIPRDAAIQEVVQRTLAAVVLGEITLDGRLVDALAYIGRQYGAVLAMHPALLIVVALGGQTNPDRQTPERSAILDALLAVLIDDPEPYQESLYTAAVLARESGLDWTADLAVSLLKQIQEQGADTMAEQARAIELRAGEPPKAVSGDDLAWVVKILLTLASLTLVAASAGRIAGSIKDVLAGIDDLLSPLLGDG